MLEFVHSKFFTLYFYFWTRQEPTQSAPLWSSGLLILDKFPKICTGTNMLAYFESASVKNKSLITLTPVANIIKPFFHLFWLLLKPWTNKLECFFFEILFSVANICG